MKLFLCFCLVIPFSSSTASDVRVKAATVTGGSAQGGSATGGSATGGSATGGSATGGSVTGGHVTGGSATGGSATGGSVTGGSVTHGSAQTGSASAGGGSSRPGIATSGTVGAGTATAYVDGREIRVTAAGSVSVNANDSAAEIVIGGRSLTVAKTQLLLDGKQVGELPAGTKKVEVRLEDQHMLSIKGDGKEVIHVKMPDK
ncbi:MAG: hypothetical protein ACO1TE_01865 [Prosthecobacter sp.]